jgi:hypothetical protein
MSLIEKPQRPQVVQNNEVVEELSIEEEPQKEGEQKQITYFICRGFDHLAFNYMKYR